MDTILTELGSIGIVPVIKIDDVEKAVPLAKALIAGGIPCAEVTFRTAAGEEAIRRIKAEVPGILLGAGTVLSTEQVDRAIAAGAKFIVSPGLNPKVVQHCIDKGIPVTPGCATPSDMERALELGLEVVKFFPAEQQGGLAYIKALAAPYTRLKFMPTGGINANNIGSYMSYEKIHACGGSWMVTPELINAGNFDAITALCQEAMRKALGFSLAHIGINGASEQEALSLTKMLEGFFGFTQKVGGSSVFAGEGIEITKAPSYGQKGHIGIGTYNVDRARAYLERRGVAFNQASINKDAATGVTKAIYLADELGGFAFHLVQKK